MKNKNIITFIKSSFSSMISALVDLIVFTILTKAFSREYFYIALSSIIARIISALINFIINKKLVFQSDGNEKKESFYFFILFVIKMLLSSFIVARISVLWVNINQTVIKCIVDFFLFFGSYVIQKRYIFKK